MNRRLRVLLILLPLLVPQAGCAGLVEGMVEGMLDSAFERESREERRLRRDWRNYRNGQPLRYHESHDHLKRHQKDYDWQKLRDAVLDDDC